MKSMILKVLGGLTARGVLAGSVLAWFIQLEDRERGLFYDGFNRQLTAVPEWAFFIRDDVWAGFGWRLFDLVWFWGGLILVFKLFSWSANKQQLPQHQDLSYPLAPEQPGEVDMLKESLELMGSKKYAEMSDPEKRAARTAVRHKYGFDTDSA